MFSNEPLVQQDDESLIQTGSRKDSQLKQLWKGTKKVLKVSSSFEYFLCGLEFLEAFTKYRSYYSLPALVLHV